MSSVAQGAINAAKAVVKFAVVPHPLTMAKAMLVLSPDTVIDVTKKPQDLTSETPQRSINITVEKSTEVARFLKDKGLMIGGATHAESPGMQHSATALPVDTQIKR